MPSTGNVWSASGTGYDEVQRKRLKTVELIVDEIDWEPRGTKMRGETLVGVRVDRQELDLRDRVKTAGGRWDPARRLWELRYDKYLPVDASIYM